MEQSAAQPQNALLDRSQHMLDCTLEGEIGTFPGTFPAFAHGASLHTVAPRRHWVTRQTINRGLSIATIVCWILCAYCLFLGGKQKDQDWGTAYLFLICSVLPWLSLCILSLCPVLSMCSRSNSRTRLQRIQGCWPCSLIEFLWKSGFEKFMYGVPTALFSFYTGFIVHTSGPPDCDWFVVIDDDLLRKSLHVALYVCGWLVVFHLAFAALEIDYHASDNVRKQVDSSVRYTCVHILFRASELAFRITMMLFLWECMRLDAWKPGFQTVEPMLIMLPFMASVLVYVAILTWSNYSAGLPPDSPVAVFVVAFATCGINTIHFLERPGYTEACNKAKTKIQGARFLELFCFAAVFSLSYSREFPHTCSDNTQTLDDDFLITTTVGIATTTPINQGFWFMNARPFFFGQLVLAICVHYLIIACHPTINHPLYHVPIRQVLRVSRERNNPEAQSMNLTVGLSQVLVMLGGGFVTSASLRANELTNTNDFLTLRRLGAGSYGVVLHMVEVVREGRSVPENERRHFGMKILNKTPVKGGQMPGVRLPADLAEAEQDIYRRIWKEQETVEGTLRCGHPFIVRLHFFCRWKEGRQFHLACPGLESQTGVEMITDSNGRREFHLGLMMEYCHLGSLEDYAQRHLDRSQRKPDFEWFVMLRRFLAEVLLALDFLHRIKGVVYRDLKMDNILVVDPEGKGGPHCKIGDFGFSKVITGEGARVASLAGSPYWAAPEMLRQATGGVRPTFDKDQHRSLDVYSFGTLAFALAHGFPYLPDHETAHPRCCQGTSFFPVNGIDQAANLHNTFECPCDGCVTLGTLDRRFPTFLGNASIKDLVKKCVATKWSDRPTTETLRNYALFTQEFEDATSYSSGAERQSDPSVNFAQLLRIDQEDITSSSFQVETDDRFGP